MVGTSEVGRLASKVVRALTRASRACLLYDFDNDAVADFLRDLEARMQEVLRHGPLILEVRPWQLLRDGEVVYRDHDREKSLAFRLYYDGVRTLSITQDVTWEEITRLVGVLSIRFAGVRQEEDDIVTLLWKADFDHIVVEAVGSYTPQDDEAEDGRDSVRVRLPIAPEEIPYVFDLPLPELRQADHVAFREVPSEELEALRGEASPSALPGHCVRLVGWLMALVAQADRPLPPEDCVPALRDIRDFLLAEGLDRELLEVVRLTHRVARSLPESGVRAGLLAVFTDREAFARMLDAAISSETVPQALVELATVAPVDELEVLLEVLASRWTGIGRTIGRTVLADGLGERLRQVADLALGMSHAIVGDFLDVAANRDPELATACALAMVRHQDRPARLKALEILERLPYRGEVGRELTEHALTSSDAEVRGRAASVLATKGERRAAPAIRRAIESGLEQGQGTPELALTVEALARLDPPGALELFREWLRPGTRLSRAKATPTPPWNLAIRGLQLIPGEESSEFLRWIHGRSEGDLKSRCAQAIAAQRGRDDRG